MKSNAELFLDAFVAIEMYLKDTLNHPGVGFTQMVHMASKKNTIVKRYDGDLNEYAQLRNAIVHSRAGENQIIAEPHDSVVETIQAIHDQLLKPKRLVDVMEFGPVYCCSVDDMLSDVLDKQARENYSVVPVYESGRYAGMIHMRLYQRFLEAYRNETIRMKDLRVKDVLKHYIRDDRVVFFNQEATLNDIILKYDSLNQKGRTIIAIVITPKGQLNENPVGIITGADMPKIIRELE